MLWLKFCAQTFPISFLWQTLPSSAPVSLPVNIINDIPFVFLQRFFAVWGYGDLSIFLLYFHVKQRFTKKWIWRQTLKTKISKIYGQICCLWKIHPCLLTPNCTRNHVITYTDMTLIPLIKGVCFWRHYGAGSVGEYNKIIWVLST